MVLHPLRLTQHRIEMFCVEITVIDLVAPRSQSCDDLAMQPRAEAASDWIGIENKNTQRTRSHNICAQSWRRISWVSAPLNGEASNDFSELLRSPGISASLKMRRLLSKN